jgi:hypothetical protein
MNFCNTYVKLLVCYFCPASCGRGATTRLAARLILAMPRGRPRIYPKYPPKRSEGTEWWWRKLKQITRRMLVAQYGDMEKAIFLGLDV